MSHFAEISELSTSMDLVAGSTPLHIAAVNGEKSTIELLLKNSSPGDYRCDVNEGDKFGRTALVYTVFGDWYECAELLLRNGALVSQEDGDRRTVLHWAAYLGKPNFVILFLRQIERGHNWNSCDLEGRTPLHYAVAQQSLKCLRLLLKHPILPETIDVADDEKKTALHWSVYYGYLEHVKLLVKAGAKTQLRDHQWNTLLHLAVANPHSPDAVQIVRLLLKRNPFFSTQKNLQSRTPLHLAVASENEELVRELSSTQERALDELDRLSRSALHYAVLRNNVNIVEILISSGAYLYTEDATGATALHYAAKNNNVDLVNYLVSNWKPDDIPDKQGRTALMWAVSENALRVLELMLGHPSRFNIHACDKQGLTPLHFACIAGNERCVMLLISKSADVSQVDKLGQTPLFKACQQGYLDVVNILMGNKMDSLINCVERCTGHTVTVVNHDVYDRTTRDNTNESAVTLGSEDQGDNTGSCGENEVFLENPEDENRCDRNREEPGLNVLERSEQPCRSNTFLKKAGQSIGNLHKNTVGNGRKMKESTICSGISENQKECIRNLEDLNGCTPLHFAAHAGHEAVCWWLLENEVDPGKKDKHGRIALHGAALNGHTSCMTAMFSYRAGLVNERDKNGNCALHWAAINGHLEAVKMLVLTYQGFPNYRVTSSNLTPLDLAIAAEQQDVTQFLIDNGALTIAGVQQVASDVIKRYLRWWLSKRKRKSMEPLLLKHRMLTRDERVKNSGNASRASDDASDDAIDDAINANYSLGKQDQPDKMSIAFQDKPIDPGIMTVKITAVIKRSDSDEKSASSNQEESSPVVLRSSECSNERSLTEDDGCLMPASDTCFDDSIDEEQPQVNTKCADLPFSSDYSNQNSSLFEPCRLGHLDIIDSLIAAGAEVNSRDEHGYTPLHFAALHGQEAVCRRLLEKGADLRKCDVQGQTPLHHTSSNGHTTCIGLLLGENPDLVHCLDKENRNALHYAVINGHLEAVSLLLLTYNSRPNISTKSHNLTALDCAIVGNHKNVVEFLTNHGAETSGVVEKAANIIQRNVRAWIIRRANTRGASCSPTQQSVGDSENKQAPRESDVDDVKRWRSVDENYLRQNNEEVLEIKQASDSCKPGLDTKLGSRSSLATIDFVADHYLPEPPKEKNRSRTVLQERRSRAPDNAIVASEKEKILKLRGDWKRIALVRRKIQAAIVIQRCFRRHLERRGVTFSDAGESGKNQKSEGILHTTDENRKLFSSETQLVRKFDPDCSFSKKVKMACKEKGRFKSCFPPLLQSNGASSAADSKSATNCSESQSRNEGAELSCNEKVEQWLHKGTVKNEREKTRANTATRRENTQRTRNSRSFLKSYSLPEDSPDGRGSISNRPRTTERLRSRCLQYPRPRSPMSTGHRPLARESLAKNAYASPAAISYNFALDTYHPLASRRGCKQASFPFKTSTRVRPNSMKRGKNGWVHTDKFAEAMASSESSRSR